jgi:hypothetical protein
MWPSAAGMCVAACEGNWRKLILIDRRLNKFDLDEIG